MFNKCEEVSDGLTKIATFGLAMTKKLFYICLLILLCLSSCRSKKQMVNHLPFPPLPVDSAALADTIGLPASLRPLLTFDQSQLKPVKRRQARRRPQKSAEAPRLLAPVVKSGTRITSRTVDVPAGYEGVSRIQIYHVTHRDVPKAFDGFRMAFVADLHYKSLLKEKGLNDVVRLLNAQQADVLLLGGDYHEGCQYVPPVMTALGRVKTRLGTYAVLGNNDYEACYEEILSEMKRNHIHLLEHRVDTLHLDGERILLAGVRNPFDLQANGVSPTLTLSPDDFVVLLTHTPDYAEDVPVHHSDLILSGHTHGGQVTLFGLYAPIVPSRYGQRFLSGLKYNSRKMPIIITNGIGTSNKAIRMFAPAEIVLVVLHRLEP